MARLGQTFQAQRQQLTRHQPSQHQILPSHLHSAMVQVCSPAGTSNILTIIGIQPPTRFGGTILRNDFVPQSCICKLEYQRFYPCRRRITFAISDMLGKSLLQWEGKAENGVYSTEISIENLSQGVYFLSVKIGERIMTQKFVKE